MLLQRKNFQPPIHKNIRPVIYFELSSPNYSRNLPFSGALIETFSKLLNGTFKMSFIPILLPNQFAPLLALLELIRELAIYMCANRRTRNVVAAQAQTYWSVGTGNQEMFLYAKPSAEIIFLLSTFFSLNTCIIKIVTQLRIENSTSSGWLSAHFSDTKDELNCQLTPFINGIMTGIKI